MRKNTTTQVRHHSHTNGSNGKQARFEGASDMSNGVTYNEERLKFTEDTPPLVEDSDEEAAENLQPALTLNQNAPLNGHRRVKMATEDGFLEEFFRNSRLHLISDQKKEMINKIGQLRKNSTVHKYDALELFKKTVRNGSSSFENGVSGYDSEEGKERVSLFIFFVNLAIQR